VIQLYLWDQKVAIDISADDLKRAMIEALKESGRTSVDLDPKDLVKAIENLKRLDKEVEKNRATMGGLAKEMITGRRVYKDMTATIEDLDDKIEKLANTSDENEIALRQELIQRRQAVQHMAQQNAATKAVVEGLTEFSKRITGVAGRAMGGLVRGLQDGSSAFALAGGLMEGAIDGANAGMQVFGAGLTTVGSTVMMGTHPALRILGATAAVAGIAISKMSDAAAAAGKFVVSYMVKEMEKTVENYQKVTNAGALFADGLTGMRNSAHAAGLTVAQFGSIITKQSSNLAATGLSVGEASKLMGDTGRAMRQSGITTQLLKLGYGFEEQAELTAQVMADLRTANSSILRDPAGIARATADYATNLRTIAAITGEDAKKRMDEARLQSTNIAFRAKMMELEKQHPNIYRDYIQASASMTAQQRQNIMESIVFGGVINETGAIMESQSSDLATLTKKTTESILNGTLDVKENQALQGQVMDRFRSQLGDLSAIGMAGMAGHLPEVNRALSELVKQSDKVTADSVAAAQDQAAKQKVATDQLTVDYVRAAEAAQNMAKTLENKVLASLGQFTHYSALIIRELEKQLAELKFPGESTPEKKFSWGEMFGAGAENAAYGTVAGGVAGSVAGGIGAVPGAAVGAGVGFVTGMGANAIKQLWGGGGATTAGRAGTPEDYNGLNLGGRGMVNGVPEAIAGGPADLRLIELAKKVQAMHPGGKFNAFNDTYHTSGMHKAGRAFDFSLPGGKPSVEDGKKIVAAIKELGFRKVIDEYNFPSEGATGGHIHAELAQGGIVNAQQGGVNVKVAEGGFSELVTPLKNGRLPGMDELISKVEQLIALQVSQLDTAEKMLWQSS